jgi:hypothetical protein
MAHFLAQVRLGVPPPGLVNAEWFFVQVIAACRKGPSAAPHAEIAKLAVAAFPFQIIGVSQLLKNAGILPNLCEGLVVQISCQNRQISARINLTSVRNEADTRTGQAPFGHCVHALGVAGAGLSGVRTKCDTR